jgi:hypothetical protein
MPGAADPWSCRASPTPGLAVRAVLSAVLCQQRGDPLELTHRVPDDLVLVHRGTAAGHGAVGGLAERVQSESLRLVGRPPLVFAPGREMRGKGAGQHRGWPGFAKPGQHPGGDAERVADEQPVPVGVVPQHHLLQRC